MPNNVTTRCTVFGPMTDIRDFYAQVFIAKPNGETVFDFNKIILMPEILLKTESSNIAENGILLVLLRGMLGAPYETLGMSPTQLKNIKKVAGLASDACINDIAAAYLEKHPEYEAAGRLCLEAILQTGYTSWYSWALGNWGTKWNAYSYRAVTPTEFLFETAWNFPSPIFHKLTEMFPRLHFKCLTFDEGWNFAGKGYFNPPEGEARWEKCEATAELYEVVYGEKPPVEEC